MTLITDPCARRPRRFAKLRAAALVAIAAPLLCAVSAGCVPRPWRPPPPRGQTWAYDSRGTYTTSVTVATGAIGPVRYGLLFAGSHFKDTPTIKHPDRFWTSQNATTFRFNRHLGNRGEPLRRGADGALLGPPGDPAAPPPAEQPAPPKGGER